MRIDGMKDRKNIWRRLDGTSLRICLNGTATPSIELTETFRNNQALGCCARVETTFFITSSTANRQAVALINHQSRCTAFRRRTPADSTSVINCQHKQPAAAPVRMQDRF
jgi:hypothetical protein